MSDILSSASDSLEKARDLSDLLSKEDITPKDILKKIEKLENLLNEMRKAMKDFPVNYRTNSLTRKVSRI